MPPALRVLSLTHVFPRAEDDAAAPFLLRHLQGVRAAGVDVRVLAPHEAGLPEEHVVGGVPVRRVRYGQRETIAYRGEMHQLVRRPDGAWQALRLVVALRRAIREELVSFAPDVLDVHWLVPGGVVARLAGLPRPARHVPTLVNVHGTDVALVGSGRLAGAVGRFALGAADEVAAMSQPLAGELARAVGREADTVLPMPAAPAPPPTPLPDDGPVLAVGRLVAEKGHHDLIDAVASLREQRRDLRLTIVGDGPERERLADHAARLGVPLDLPGALAPERLEEHYGRALVVAVPSHREGFGLVAAEALARHRPVVASDAGGLAEIVTDDDPAGPTGWSVPPRDVPALAAALATAIDERDEAVQRAEAGAERVRRRWSAEALGAQTAERLRALADRA